MYTRDLPAEHIEEAKSIMERNRSVLLMPHDDLKRLFYFYYRYIKVIRRGENAVKMMEKDLSCPACKGKVIMYFRNKMEEGWQ